MDTLYPRLHFVAGALSIASLVVAANLVAAPAQKPREQHTSDFAPAPSTLAELRDKVDAVVVGRVESSVVRTFGHYQRIATLHTVRVLDVLKPDNGIGEVGSAFEMEQSAGELELPDKVVTLNPGFAPLRPGDTHIFFLSWHHAELHYAMAYGPHASFRINGLTIETPRRGEIAKRFHGASVAGFLEALRR